MLRWLGKGPLLVARRALSSVDEPRLLLVTTCGKCQGPIRKSFSKLAYEKGVVLIRCDGCGVRHLIADHIGWFNHVKGHDLEDYYPGQVKRGDISEYLVLSNKPDEEGSTASGVGSALPAPPKTHGEVETGTHSKD